MSLNPHDSYVNFKQIRGWSISCFMQNKSSLEERNSVEVSAGCGTFWASHSIVFNWYQPSEELKGEATHQELCKESVILCSVKLAKHTLQDQCPNTFHRPNWFVFTMTKTSNNCTQQRSQRHRDNITPLEISQQTSRMHKEVISYKILNIYYGKGFS